MTDEDFARFATAHLRDRYGCHAVLLYGSRARGDATVDSDWDLVGLRDDPAEVWDARCVDGRSLDAFVYGTASFATLEASSLRLRGARLLLDTQGAGAALLGRLEAFYAAGPPAVDADTRRSLAEWYRKTLLRASRDDLEARLRRLKLLDDALETWHRLRGLWFGGTRSGAREMSLRDPAAYAALCAALAPDAPWSSLVSLAAAVLGEDFIPPSPPEPRG